MQFLPGRAEQAERNDCGKDESPISCQPSVARMDSLRVHLCRDDKGRTSKENKDDSSLPARDNAPRNRCALRRQYHGACSEQAAGPVSRSAVTPRKTGGRVPLTMGDESSQPFPNQELPHRRTWQRPRSAPETVACEFPRNEGENMLSIATFTSLIHIRQISAAVRTSFETHVKALTRFTHITCLQCVTLVAKSGTSHRSQKTDVALSLRRGQGSAKGWGIQGLNWRNFG